MRHVKVGSFDCWDLQRLCRLLLIEVDLHCFEHSQISSGHEHRLKVLVLIPDTLLDLLAMDWLEFVVTNLGVELAVRFEASTDDPDP